MTTNIAPGRALRGLPGPPGEDLELVDHPDFFRTEAAQVPDGVNDMPENIVHLGRAGFGNGSTPFNANQGGVILALAASLESAAGVRTGIHNRVGGSLYSTGVLPTVYNAVKPANAIVGFVHNNGTQGIGVGFDGLHTAGSLEAQNIGFQVGAGGNIYHQWRGLEAGYGIHQHRIPNYPNANEGAILDYEGGGTLYTRNIIRRFVTGSGSEWILQTRDGDNGLSNNLNLMPSPTVNTDAMLKVGQDVLNDTKLSLFGTTEATLYGWGIRSRTLLARVPGLTALHLFTAGPAATERQIMSLRGEGYLQMMPRGVAHPVDGAENTANRLGWGRGMVYWGNGAANFRPFIGATSDGALHLGANALNMIDINNDGRIQVRYLPVFANDAAAAALPAATLYRTATGELRVKL